MSKQFSFIYKTTNILNQKIYIGKHSTNDINDGYIGSGKYFKRAIKKYGREHFNREILVMCSKQELDDLEKFFIKKYDAINEGYNFSPGGEGGNVTRNAKWIDQSSESVYISRLKRKQDWDNTYWTKENREKHSKIIKETQWGEGSTKRRSDHSKRMIGDKNPSAKKFKIITTDEIYVIIGLRGWCKENNVSENLLRKNVNKGKIERTSVKDTSFTWSKNKQKIRGWEIIELSKEIKDEYMED